VGQCPTLWILLHSLVIATPDRLGKARNATSRDSGRAMYLRSHGTFIAF